jgi:hypothetical protein
LPQSLAVKRPLEWPSPRSELFHDILLGLRGSNLLGLWSIEDQTEELSVRIVRPIGTWKCGSRARIDIDVRLPRDAQDLAGLEFVPTDNLEVELPVDIDEDETFGQAGAPDA